MDEEQCLGCDGKGKCGLFGRKCCWCYGTGMFQPGPCPRCKGSGMVNTVSRTMMDSESDSGLEAGFSVHGGNSRAASAVGPARVSTVPMCS